MKRSILILILYTMLYAAPKDSLYTTIQILNFVEKPLTIPNFTVKARGRGGYGTSEFLYTKPSVDLYSGLQIDMDILSTADIKNKREKQNQQRREILDLLSQIKEHLTLSWQYITQRETYKTRLELLQKRIKAGLEETSSLYPIEKTIMDLNSKIYHEQAEIERVQLSVASFGGDKWEDLFRIVKHWDKKL